MVADFFKSIKWDVYERMFGPLSGSFIIAWVVWNHRLIFTLFSSMQPEDRFIFIDTKLYPGEWYQDLEHLLGWPFLFALIYLIVYPFLASWPYRIYLMHQEGLKKIKQKAQGKSQLTVDQSANIMRQNIRQQEQHDKEIQSKHDEIELLKMSLSKAEGELATNKGKEKENEERIQRLQDKSDKDNAEIDRLSREGLKAQGYTPIDYANPMSVLGSGSFLFIFRHHYSGNHEHRKISFNEDGTIGDGRHDNENTWRIKNGMLELIKKDGDVQSRFYYLPQNQKGLFIHTNDQDTLSERGQIIIQVKT